MSLSVYDYGFKANLSKNEEKNSTIQPTQILDPQSEKLLIKLNAENGPLDDLILASLQTQQVNVKTEKLSGIHEIKTLQIESSNGPFNCRIYTPVTHEVLPVFVFFHGGGWVLGNLDEYDYFCQKIALTPCIVVSVEYHLAPQYKFPKPLEDCYFATQWVSNNIQNYGGNPHLIAVGGDSAGGNLAASVTLMAREKQDVKICHQVLIFPALDPKCDSSSYQKFGKEYYLTTENMQFFWSKYLGDNKGEDPYVSPSKASSLSDLPSATIMLADFDPLFDEGLAYAARLKKEHVHVNEFTYPSFHGFLNFEKELSLADKLMEEVAQILKFQFYTKNN